MVSSEVPDSLRAMVCDPDKAPEPCTLFPWNGSAYELRTLLPDPGNQPMSHCVYEMKNWEASGSFQGLPAGTDGFFLGM